MLKYITTEVTFAEIPDEISLCINISNCPIHCSECHSKELWEDIGTPLDLMHLTDLVDRNKGITCVCFMGGDISPSDIDDLAQGIKEYYPGIKVGWYSGRDSISKEIDLQNFDYIKYGHYDSTKGAINNRTTNQVMLEITMIDNKVLTKDITSRFWNDKS